MRRFCQCWPRRDGDDGDDNDDDNGRLVAVVVLMVIAAMVVVASNGGFLDEQRDIEYTVSAFCLLLEMLSGSSGSTYLSTHGCRYIMKIILGGGVENAQAFPSYTTDFVYQICGLGCYLLVVLNVDSFTYAFSLHLKPPGTRHLHRYGFEGNGGRPDGNVGHMSGANRGCVCDMFVSAQQQGIQD